MSAVSNRVMPRSIALWITLREVSRSVRWPKLLQPRPTAETRRPEPPRLRICMDQSCGDEARRTALRPADIEAERRGTPWHMRMSGHDATSARIKKMRPRSDAATDGDRLGRVICDGGPDQTRAEPNRALLRRHDSGTYPQPG